ncbi:MAG: 7-cyano-7-deazaguanine synthase [Eubacteriales bacterium]|nr:7-cyano-7-deazaguanine synthase [Eubacteriales bacterium]MDD4444192.1 7-cyano-7-deazaguanine synthase [Eubacteriales bacterium]
MSQQTSNVIRVNCGELCTTRECTAAEINLLHRDIGDITSNITIGYAKFVRDADELPEKILDLLQIAAYVFCGDRMANRGSRKSVNNESWARSFEFHIPVLALDFWSDAKTKKALNDVLTFMTGDRGYNFIFSQSDKNPAEVINKQLSLFTGEYQSIDEAENTDIVLFSGGLDSLAGTVQRLNEHLDRSLCVVSHKSSKTVTHTQNVLVDELNKKYGNRVKQYSFECCNHDGLKSKDETQRTRIFLFSAIAFSLCHCYDKNSFYVYENGITSMNLSKQADVINGRASRTTHPKTLGLLRKFYRLLNPSFDIIAPYYNQTKAEIVEVFRKYNSLNLIANSVSCSSSRKKPGQVPHCGCCSQCIDRRFSLYAAGLNDYDAEYANDFIHSFPDDDNNETKQRIYITMRLANLEDISTQDAFVRKYPDDVTDLVAYWQGSNADDKLDEIYDLVCRYGKSVMDAATRMRNKFDDLSLPVNKNSLLGVISERQYKKSPIINRIEEIDAFLRETIPIMFQREKPTGENDFNDKIEAILKGQGSFTREHPSLQFWRTEYKPDHAQDSLLIESKYVRGATTPSKITEGIAADMTKAPSDMGFMFVVYDPDRQIQDDKQFSSSFEGKRKDCFVRVYR